MTRLTICRRGTPFSERRFMQTKRLLLLCLCAILLFSGCSSRLTPLEPTEMQTEPQVVVRETKTETKTAEEVVVIPLGTEGKISLKVVSYNVNTYSSEITDYRNWYNRRDALCDYLLSLEADVICVQETPELYRDYFAEKLGELYGWEHFNHNMTLYLKSRFEKLNFTPNYYGADPTEKAPAYDASMERNFTVTHLKENESGAEFYAVATHFDHKGLKARIMAARQLIQTFSQSEIPYVVMGDFNSTEESYAYKELTKLFLDAQKVAPVSDSGRSFNKWGELLDPEGLAIDFCFVSPVNIEVKSHAILRDRWGADYFYSDHNPIKVELELAY